ncbi:MAG: hypothetical protein ACI9R3_002405 [Verrucomicrobiales bacterium]|jgi:hypothetical protein
MKLYQNQLWKQGSDHYRIVHLQRMAVDYKKIDPDHPEGGAHLRATKKEFCRLIRGAKEVNNDN